MPAGQRSWCALVLSLVAGCGHGDTATVTGIVSLDGTPVVGGPQTYGTVSFLRKEGGGAPAVGIIDASGRYSLRTGSQEGVAPGAYLVGIAVKKITPPTTADGLPTPHLITPERYASETQSGFRAEVTPGANTIDFALETGSNR